jgi:hypothetical protein
MTTYTYTPDINVSVGASYIAFVTNQPGPSGVSLGGGSGFGLGEMELGTGPAKFMFAAGNPSDPTYAWSPWGPYNAAFNADFTAFPEPSTWVMMLLGFAGLAYAGYRRARAGHETLAA